MPNINPNLPPSEPSNVTAVYPAGGLSEGEMATLVNAPAVAIAPAQASSSSGHNGLKAAIGVVGGAAFLVGAAYAGLVSAKSANVPQATPAEVVTPPTINPIMDRALPPASTSTTLQRQIVPATVQETSTSTSAPTTSTTPTTRLPASTVVSAPRDRPPLTITVPATIPSAEAKPTTTTLAKPAQTTTSLASTSSTQAPTSTIKAPA